MKKLYLVAPLVMVLAVSGCTKPKPNYSDESEETSVNESQKELIHVDSYVADVSATAPIMVSGKYSGADVDYVVSSYPVIFQAKQQNTKLSVYSDVANLFGERYQTEGFPQAGLFMKASLLETVPPTSINSFLKGVDESLTDLVSGGTQAIANMNAYNSDVEEQKSYFGYPAPVLRNVQATNGMAFIERSKNPSLEEYRKFEEPLGISLSENDVSSYYTSEIPTETEVASTLNFSVTVPMGAPNAVFSKFAGSSNLTITSPANVKAAFAAKQADFIIFDSVNGVNLSKANQGAYKLVRMITFGNLYVVSTGHDENGQLDESDNIVGYGENLVPDLAFKAVYSK